MAFVFERATSAETETDAETLGSDVVAVEVRSRLEDFLGMASIHFLCACAYFRGYMTALGSWGPICCVCTSQVPLLDHVFRSDSNVDFEARCVRMCVCARACVWA